MRKFECKGLEQNVVNHWDHQFTVGKVYKEKKFPQIAEGLMEGKLYLQGDGDMPYFVDASQFEEVKDEEAKNTEVNVTETTPAEIASEGTTVPVVEDKGTLADDEQIEKAVEKVVEEAPKPKKRTGKKK